MKGIYCLVVSGTVLNDEVLDFLHSSAHNLIRTKERRGKIQLSEMGIKGRIATDYKLAMMGTACGFTFKAQFEWSEGETKVEFIVRPCSDKIFKHLMEDTHWLKTNSAFMPTPDQSWRN